MMELPKVVIKDDYQDYLNGIEVKAALMDSTKESLQTGTHVIAFKDSIAATTEIPVPKNEQDHYIGIEGMVTEVETLNPGESTSVRQNGPGKKNLARPIHISMFGLADSMQFLSPGSLS